MSPQTKGRDWNVPPSRSHWGQRPTNTICDNMDTSTHLQATASLFPGGFGMLATVSHHGRHHPKWAGSGSAAQPSGDSQVTLLWLVPGRCILFNLTDRRLKLRSQCSMPEVILPVCRVPTQS